MIILYRNYLVQEMLIIANPTGHGTKLIPHLKNFEEWKFKTVSQVDVSKLPEVKVKVDEIPKLYSTQGLPALSVSTKLYGI